MSCGRRPKLIAAILANISFHKPFIHTPPKSLFTKRRGTFWEPDPEDASTDHPSVPSSAGTPKSRTNFRLYYASPAAPEAAAERRGHSNGSVRQ